MSLRKVSSVNSTSPLKKNKMEFMSYGVHDADSPNNCIGLSIQVDTNDDHQDDDYDKVAKKPKASSPTSGNNLLGVVANLPHQVAASLSPSNSYEQTPTTPSHPGIPPKRSSSNDMLQHNHPHKNNSNNLPPPFVIQVTAIASLGGVLFGYDMGVIAGALPQLATTFDLTDSQQELVVSILYVGGGLGAAFGGSLCDMLGRKPAILWTDVTFMVGASVLFTAPHLVSVCVGRIIVGFAVAVSGIADVSYLHEIAPTQWRGAIVSVNEACISLGFLLAFVVGAVFAPPPNDDTDNLQDDEDNLHAPRGWRYMFGLGGLLALVQFLGMWSMPESPIWLKDQGRHEEAKAALRRIHGGDRIPPEDAEGFDQADDTNDLDDPYEDEYDNQNDHHLPTLPHRSHSKTPPRTPQDVAIESKASYESLSSNPETVTSTTRTTSTLPSSPGPGGHNLQQKCLACLHKITTGYNHLRRILFQYRRQVWIALFLSVTQQFCGQTSVLNYAPTILGAVVQQDADGQDEELSGWATLSIGVVKFLATVLVIWKIEYVGRRTLLLVGMGTIAFGLLLVAIAFSASSPYAKEQHADENGVMVQKGSGFYFALPGVLLVVSGYSMSFGPLTWLITSELFPTEIRGRALGTSTIVTYLCAAAVTYSFLTAQSLLGTTVVFLGYMLITLVGMVFACLAIPDTGGKTQEEIASDLSNMPFWRRFSGAEAIQVVRRRRASSSGRLSSCSLEDAAAAPSRLFQGTVLNNGAGRIVEAELT